MQKTSDPLLGRTLQRDFEAKTGFVQQIRVIEIVNESEDPERHVYKVQITRNDLQGSKIGRTRTASKASLERGYTLLGG